MTTRFLILAFAVLCLTGHLSAIDAAFRYVSVKMDSTGNLYLVTDRGKERQAPRIKGQTKFESVSIAEDGQTVGWLADYPDPGVNYYKSATVPGNLIIYRDRHIIRIFNAEQVFWSWGFRNRGAEVAYCTGPTHGGAAECLLRRVDSGVVMERWVVDSAVALPVWARGLRY